MFAKHICALEYALKEGNKTKRWERLTDREGGGRRRERRKKIWRCTERQRQLERGLGKVRGDKDSERKMQWER